MDSGLTHQQRQQRDNRQDVDQALQRQLEAPAPDLEGLEEGQLSGERATGLQASLGNQSILNLLNNLNQTASAVDALDQGEEESADLELEVESDEDLERDAELRQVGGGGGGGGAGAPSDSPWDVGVLFGGEDDPDAPAQPRRRRRRQGQQGPADLEGIFDGPEEDAARPAATAEMSAALGLPPDAPTERWGDSELEAIELPLREAVRLEGRTLSLDTLEAITGRDDPLHRATAIGRFLSHGRGELGFAALLAGPASGLLPESAGFASAAARLATLAICAEREEGGGIDTDRAAQLAMCTRAWPRAMAAARQAARESKLHAPLIAARALGLPGLPPDARLALPPPSVLGGRALEAAIPLGFIPPVPALVLPDPPSPTAEADPELSAIDAVLARFTGGLDPAALPPPPLLSAAAINPLLGCANALMNALGRAQVEMAAAAVAVRMVRDDAPIRATLNTADKALRELARGVVLAGRQLEKLRGKHLRRAREPAEKAAEALQRSRDALASLRAWAMATLAGALDAQARARASA